MSMAMVADASSAATPWRRVPGLRAAAEVVAEIRPRDARVVSRQRLVTDEGEYAARAVLAVGRARLAVGLVYGDDQHLVAVGDACALGAAEIRAVRLGLPALRRRRYVYAPPAGFRAASGSGLGAVWHRRDALVVVHAALPVGGRLGADALADHVCRHTTFPTRRAGAASFRTARGLAGRTIDLDGDGGYVAQAVVLEDGPFLYALRLETNPREYHENWRAFSRLVDSIEPLPIRAATGGDHGHWAE